MFYLLYRVNIPARQRTYKLLQCSGTQTYPLHTSPPMQKLNQAGNLCLARSFQLMRKKRDTEVWLQMSDYSSVFRSETKIYSIVSWYFVFDKNEKPLSWFYKSFFFSRTLVRRHVVYVAPPTWEINGTEFAPVLVWFCCWYTPGKLLIKTYWISRGEIPLRLLSFVFFVRTQTAVISRMSEIIRVLALQYGVAMRYLSTWSLTAKGLFLP